VDFDQSAVLLKEHKTARKTGLIPLVPTVVKSAAGILLIPEDLPRDQCVAAVFRLLFG
jgi:hypothetical protein